MINDLKQAEEVTDVTYLTTDAGVVSSQDSGVIPFPTTEAMPQDDRAIALAFMRKEHESGRRLRFSDKGTLWQYDPEAGTWRRVDKGGVIAFNGRLWDFMLACVTPNEREDGIGRRYRSVKKTLFETVAEYHSSPDDFDSDGPKLAVSNGVYDPDQDELLDRSPDHMLTLGLGYAYDPKATCPRFLRFLDEVLVRHSDPGDDASPLVPDPELRLLVQEMMGYCLATHCRGHQGFFLLGYGANGKSALIGVIRQIVGEHNVCDGFDVRRISNPNSNMRLTNKLVAIQNELPGGARIDEAAYKAITAGDSVAARYLYNDEVSITPYATLIMAGNVLPETRDTSLGFWRRTAVIPFLNTFMGETEDTDLQEKLAAELPGILNFALEGYRRLRDNHWKFTEAEAAVKATKVYREDSDPMRLWSDDCLRASATESSVRIMDLFEHYLAYCGKRRYQPLNYNNFSKRLKVITENREGDRWATVAADGTPFSMEYRRFAASRMYAGNFVLGHGDD